MTDQLKVIKDELSRWPRWIDTAKDLKMEEDLYLCHHNYKNLDPTIFDRSMIALYCFDLITRKVHEKLWPIFTKSSRFIYLPAFEIIPYIMTGETLKLSARFMGPNRTISLDCLVPIEKVTLDIDTFVTDLLTKKGYWQIVIKGVNVTMAGTLQTLLGELKNRL